MIETKLRALGDANRASREKRYLKSSLTHLGVRVPDIRKVVAGVAKAEPDIYRSRLLELATKLWARPIHEMRMASMVLLEQRSDLLQSRDLSFLERLIRESRTWALVDGLAVSVVGDVVSRFQSSGRRLDEWARDEDFWVRRAAMLALLKPLRAGGGDFDRFARYAESMLEEKEFFIRKAIGWILRETSKKQPDVVFKWLRPRVERASGVTVREAVKYLDDERRNEVLSAYQSRAGG